MELGIETLRIYERLFQVWKIINDLPDFLLIGWLVFSQMMYFFRN